MSLPVVSSALVGNGMRCDGLIVLTPSGLGVFCTYTIFDQRRGRLCVYGLAFNIRKGRVRSARSVSVESRGCRERKRSGRSAEIPDNSLDPRLNVDWLWTDQGG